MEFKREILFNSLIIIENLKSGEKKTGLELFEDSRYKAWAQRDFNVEYFEPKNPGEFRKLLASIRDRCRNSGLYPWIHLEIHGYYKGLVFGDAENELEWNEVRELLIEINHSTNFNLFISMAVCFGAFILPSIFRITSVAPFMGCYASEKSENERNILKVFGTFYDEFFTSWNLKQADKKVRETISGTNFRLFQSEVLFLQSYVGYLREQLTPNALQKRWKRHVDAGLIRGNAKLKRKRRHLFIKSLKDDEFNKREFGKFRNTFFGLTPGNEGQYSNVRYDMLKRFSKKLKKR